MPATQIRFEPLFCNNSYMGGGDYIKRQKQSHIPSPTMSHPKLNRGKRVDTVHQIKTSHTQFVNPEWKLHQGIGYEDPHKSAFIPRAYRMSSKLG